MAKLIKKYNLKPSYISINGHDIILYKIKNNTVKLNCFIKNGFAYENIKNL